MSRKIINDCNKKICDFIYKNYNASEYRNYEGRIRKYFNNYYKNSRTIKFAIFQDPKTVNLKDIENFLKVNKIHYKDVHWGYTRSNYGSLIISFNRPTKNEWIYDMFKDQIDECVDEVENSVFKPLGIKSLGIDIRLNYIPEYQLDPETGEQDVIASVGIVHYLTQNDVDKLGKAEEDGIIDDIDFECNGFDIEEKGCVCPNGPVISGYVYSDGYVCHMTEEPSVQFYWGWLPKKIFSQHN